MIQNKKIINFIGIVLLLSVQTIAFSQQTDSIKPDNTFKTSTTLTNNGISLIPTFSLGKPAAIFNMSIGRKLSFDPEFRFALSGKPWSFIFWWRYKIMNTNKLSMNIGAHPALTFKTLPVIINGSSREEIVSQRFIAGELAPNYYITKSVSIGLYYLYSRGIESNSTNNTHFLTLNCNFLDISLYRQFYLKLNPQVYYLKMDRNDGFYASSGITLANRNWPVSASVFFNKIIKTEITASKDLVWNISLVYSFSKKYIQQ